MKKLIALLLALVVCLSLFGCGKKVDNIEVDGQSVTAVDFLVEHLGTYIKSEGYVSREELFESCTESEAMPFTVTRVIEVSAKDLGEKNIAVHFLAVKADCHWAKGEGEIFSDILLVVDYETGEVYDEFVLDPTWIDMNNTKEQQIAYMLNGPLVGAGYEGGTIIVDSEERVELTKSDIASINEKLHS